MWAEPEAAEELLLACTGFFAPRLKERLRSGQRQTFLEQLRLRSGRAIAAAAPDLVVVASAGLAVYLPPLDGLGIPVVYDAHNVERALWRDLTRLHGELGDGTFNARFRDRILAGEAVLVEGAAQLWACSPSDAELFAATYGPMKPDVRIVPNTVDVASFAAVRGPRPTTPAIAHRRCFSPAISAIRPTSMAPLPSAGRYCPWCANPHRAAASSSAVGTRRLHFWISPRATLG